jgi:hypothetical protein
MRQRLSNRVKWLQKSWLNDLNSLIKLITTNPFLIKFNKPILNFIMRIM